MASWAGKTGYKETGKGTLAGMGTLADMDLYLDRGSGLGTGSPAGTHLKSATSALAQAWPPLATAAQLEDVLHSSGAPANLKSQITSRSAAAVAAGA